MGTISKAKRPALLPSSTQLRYSMAYIAITTAALIILNLYASATVRHMIFSAQQRNLSDRVQVISTALLQLDALTPTQVEQAVELPNDPQITRVVVTDAQGMALYDSLSGGNAQGKLLLFPELTAALMGSDVFYCIYDGGAVESRICVPLTRSGSLLGAVYLTELDRNQGTLIETLQDNVLRISAALEAAVILFSIFFSAAFSRRLRRILLSIQMMRSGDYSYRIALRGHDEIDRLGREFNTLAERLNASDQRRKQFVSDASHELKTPLASIKLLSDSILQNEMDAATQREFIGDIGREADRLGRLSQKLLTLTRLDSDISDDREIVDAAQTVRKVTRMLAPLASLRGICLQSQLEEGCSVLTVEDDLYQVVFNLTENAIKYNRENGWVRLCLQRRQEDVYLTVSDNGVGIPEEALPHIFERFYRVDKARSRAAGGAGLGLSIVHDMVLRNMGTICAESREGGGTVFSVTFPYFDTEEETAP